ncbi:hypothetical protein RHGRI_031348 [Rhododendron griersonianum]|uniref:Uncharacterized protein n=1 Tax=Rhododendron griersonianum TaxID=479676 RepID=A0AAV6I7V5_9ERIC|nr:hypothetical protein RHGRI_031348 [Rhododendron griersonianum]
MYSNLCCIGLSHRNNVERVVDLDRYETRFWNYHQGFKVKTTKQRSMIRFACEGSGKSLRETWCNLKCECPFQVTCVKEDEGWTLTVMNGMHNHPCALQEEGHSHKRRMSSKHIKMMVQKSLEMLKPKEILHTVNQMDACKMVTIKSVYNACYKQRNKLPQQEPKKMIYQ